MYKIELGLPIPAAGKESKYPFKYMQIGDSFLVPYDKSNHPSKQQRKIANCASMWKQNNNKMDYCFVTRQQENGIRVWRKLNKQGEK